MINFGSSNDSSPAVSPFNCDEELLASYRLDKVRELVAFAAANSPFHSRRFREIGLEPGDLKSLKDYENIPVMTKTDVRLHNTELNMVEKGKVREVFTTSGTTGDPVVYRYSAADLENLAVQGGDLLRVAGVEQGDVFQLTMPLEAAMWIAGLNFWIAFQRAGAGTVRFGAGNSEGQLDAAASLGVNGFFLTASFAAILGETRIKIRNPPEISKLLIVNENILDVSLARNDVGARIDSLWPEAETRAVYGNTELGFSGAECSAKKGFHTHPGAHYFEVLDPATGSTLPDGSPGRFVATSLLYRGMPLIRYAIDDVTFMMRERCECGLCGDRFGPIIGRLDDMLKIKGGVSLYPPAIENILLSIPQVADYYFEAFKEESDRQNIRIFILPAPGAESTASDIVTRDFNEKLHFKPIVKLATSDLIAAKTRVSGKRKPQRFHDLREATGSGNE